MGEDGESLQVTESGTYSMSISANPTCQVSDEVVIQFFDLPVLDFGDDRSACPGETVELDAGDAQNSFSWSSESMGALAETGHIMNVTESDTYYVEVRNDFARDLKSMRIAVGQMIGHAGNARVHAAAP